MDLIRLRQIAQSFFHNARTSHDWEHTERVFRLAERIAQAEGGDPEVVAAAALLHDIGREQEANSEGAICHATAGAELAAPILKTLEVEPERTAQILHCIKTHRFRGDERPQTLEAKILFDADKLDSIGAVGIGRAFLFAGEVGANLHNPDIVPDLCHAYTREDTAYHEFLIKLSHIKDRMMTATGQRLAQQRHTFMEMFFQQLNDEVTGIR